MVFLVQNTQNRNSKAVNLKLDGIIRAVKGARNQLINLEGHSDEDPTKLEKQFERVRKKLEWYGDSGLLSRADCASRAKALSRRRFPRRRTRTECLEPESITKTEDYLRCV